MVKETTNSLAEHLRFENLLGEVSSKLVNLPLESIDDAIKETLKLTVDFFDVDRCHIGKVEEDNQKLSVTHFYFKQRTDSSQIKYVDEQFFSYIFDRIKNGETIAIEDLDELPDELVKERQYFIKNNISSFLIIPLKMNDKVFAALSLSTVNRLHLWPDDTIRHISIVFNIIANVLQRHEALKQVGKEQIWSEAVLDGMPQLAYVFDKDGRMKRWNKNVENVLGYSPVELQNRPVGDFIVDYDKQRVSNLTKKIIEDGQERSVNEDLITKNGKILHYYGSGKRIKIDGEYYLVGMTIDITELKKSQEKIEAQIEQIKILKEQLQTENLILREEVEGTHNYKNIIGESGSLKHILYRIEQVAPQNTTVLLEGETGTGKELFAHAIHQQSQRRNKPFVKVNCSSVPANLIESEFFGHEKGAFTGAIQRQIGRFELADGGTIFLDEISEIPFELQAKLLRVLQEGEFERIGSPKTLRVDVRVIAATNRDLEEDIRNKLFRKDLYYRLNVYPISIIPLRKRQSDIPILTEYFISRFNKKMGKNISRIPKKTVENLQNYTWPGNIRELENIIERAVILSPGSSLKIEQLRAPGFETVEIFLPLSEFERNYIIKVLEKTFWRVDGPEGAARILDMHPETLRSRMRKLGIQRPKQ